MTVLNLVASRERAGATSALALAWQATSKKITEAPRKSSFSEYRAKVSANFFKEIYEEDLRRLPRQTYRDFFLYAVDGDELELPLSKEILLNGYRGRDVENWKETHYPRMKTVQAVDLINGVIKAFTYSAKESEFSMGCEMALKLEENSITMYDRLYCAYKVMAAHRTAKNFAVIRVNDKQANVPKAILKFCRSESRAEWINYLPASIKGESIPVRLIKIKNPRTNIDLVVMTNLSEEFSNEDVGRLYVRRWGIETSFRDLTSTLKLTQWRSKTLNGILQEIYAVLWLVNQVRCRAQAIINTSKDWLETKYEKSNLKLLIAITVEQFSLLNRRQSKRFHVIFDHFAKLTLEKREHLSRSYPRELKQSTKKYRNAGLVETRRWTKY